MKNNKLRAVIRHEYLTIIKQASFWISLFATPLIIAVVVLINVLSGSNDVDTSKTKLDVVVLDEAKVVDSKVKAQLGLRIAEPNQAKSELIQSVKDGKLDGLIVYPSDLNVTGEYSLYSDDTNDNNADAVAQIAKVALQRSLLAGLDDGLATLATTGGVANVQAYKHGEPVRELPEFLVPGAFLVLFYMVLIFSVGYALYSVSEEKENRSIEMVLSYVKPKTLILGKLLGIILVTFTQLAIIGLLAVVAYSVARGFGNELSLPMNLADITFVPIEILFGIGFLIVGFIFYVALMAMIGAIFPSSKEAGGFSSVFFILPAVPFWGLDAIVDKPNELFSQILTFFPLTSPTTVLFRNTIGNLTVVEGTISLAILCVATLGVVLLAAKAFRLGTLEYSDRVKITSLFK